MHSVTPLAVALLVVSSIGLAGPVGGAVLSASEPRQVESCTVIDEPGSYVLTQDLSASQLSDEPCIQITASDVVLDGQGHDLFDMLSRPAIRAGTTSHRVSNVTVRNVTTDGLRGDVVQFESVDGGTVEDVTLDGNRGGIHVANSTDVRVANSSLEGTGAIGPTTSPSSYGVRLVNTSDAVVEDSSLNRFVRGAAILVEDGSTNTTIAGNDIRGCVECADDLRPGDLTADGDYGTGIDIDGASGTTVVDNDVGYHDEAVHVRGNASGTHVAGNTLSHSHSGVRIATMGPAPAAESAVENNTVTDNTVGIRATTTRGTVRVDHNAIVGNDYGIYTPNAGVCPPDGERAVSLAVTENDLGNNTEYAVRNDRLATLNATGNFWGAASGPSSANDTDAPFEDPVTGEPADGQGDAVSERPDDPGVANVHFDPWLEQSATNGTLETAG